MSQPSQLPTRPAVRIVGEVDHADFRDAVHLVHRDAEVVATHNSFAELIVIAQARPGAISSDEIELLQRRWPLTGVVGLLGTWCEGETRTGRPWPGVERLYWYEFPAWWQRQLALRAAGRCPDWARPNDFTQASRVVRNLGRGRGLPGSPPSRTSANGLVILSTAVRDTAAALADVLQQAGYSTVWQPPGQPAPVVRGAAAGIWDGGQLSEREVQQLAAFCKALGKDAAPVIAVLDFPRRDRVGRALEAGAATVAGKPWINSDLIATIKQAVVGNSKRTRAA